MRAVAARIGGVQGFGPEEAVLIESRVKVQVGGFVRIKRRSIAGDKVQGIGFDARWTPKWTTYTVESEKGGVLYLKMGSGDWGRHLPVDKLKSGAGL